MKSWRSLIKTRSPDCTNRSGFSLLELLIAMAIVAIIASIAIPAWRTHLLTTRRTEAVAMLLELANRQEQFRLQHQRYAATDELTAMPPAGLGIPNNGERYILTTSASDHTYTAFVTVDATGTKADDTQCWLFGMDESGKKWSENAAGEITTTLCWRG